MHEHVNLPSLTLTSFSLVDWILVGVLLGFAWIGWRRGLVVSALSFVGFVGGALAAAFGLPVFMQAISSGAARAIALGIGILLAALAGQFLLSLLAERLRSGMHWHPARFLDAAGGAALSIAALAMLAWIVSSALSTLPRHPVTEQVRNSQVLIALDRTVPDAVRNAFTGLRDSVDGTTLPQVFSGLAEFQGPQVDPADPQILQDPAIKEAAASVVRVAGRACGVQQRGSGFLFDPRLVLTNAHVVAGLQRVRVDTVSGPQRATVVLFDPRLDLAVLALASGSIKPLPWSQQAADFGDSAVVIGYPDGAGQQATAVRIRGTLTARGNDIHGRSGVEREVIAFRGTLQPGVSGGPLITPDGAVLGMVFGRSLGGTETGYAITAAQIRAALQRDTDSRGVDTGRC